MEFTHCVFSVDGVKLLSAAGTWQTPGKLTLVRNGVHPESVVSSKLEPAFGELENGENSRPGATGEASFSVAR